MTDLAWQAIVQHIFRREQRSLLQYVHEVSPWIRSGEEERAAVLRTMVAEEQAAAGELARVLQKRHVGVGPLGTYPLHYASLAFVSLDFLVPHLIDDQKQLIARLEADLAKIGDAAARTAVQNLLEQKRRHLKTLDELAARSPQPVPA